ncbi:MAG: polysulfide reductase NrfD [Firmicutes bacterium]|nr:polysulfide reductase NrfD [Bacillota bacterium]
MQATGVVQNQEVICKAALRSVHNGGRRFKLWVALLALPVLWGFVAWLYQVTNGLGVTALSNQYFWGLYETNFVTFIGLSYGGALVSAILRLTGARWRAPITRLAEAMALITLMIGGAFAIIHLGHPERVWQFFVTPQLSSPIIWDFVALNTYLAATVIFLYLPMIPDLAAAASTLPNGWRRRIYLFLARGWQGRPDQERLLERATMGISILIIPVAITVHSVLAWTFSLHNRAGWHSSIYGPYFVVGALFSGVALVILVVAAFRRAYRLEEYIGKKQFEYLGYLMTALAVLYLYFTFTDLLAESYIITTHGTQLLEFLLVTRYAPLFWAFLVLGIFVPILTVAWPRTRTVPGIVFSAALVVLTMWLKRFLIVVPSLAVPLVEHTPSTQSYVPSWVEASISLAALAAIPLLLILFFRVFPVLSIKELEEAAEAH